MNEINALDWILQVDKLATTTHYETAATDLCDCAYCRNFVSAFPNRFPKELLEILYEIGIDPLKPFHISEVCADKDNNHRYIGNYDFIGKVVKRPNERHQIGTPFNLDILGWTPKLNIQFSVTIPWVLNEEIESVACEDLES